MSTNNDDINRVHLRGRIDTKPEQRRTPRGNDITRFRLETVGMGRDGKPERSEFHTVVTWMDLARYAATLSVGQRVEVIGAARTRRYQSPTHGGRRYEHSVVADRISVVTPATPEVVRVRPRGTP